MAVKQYTNVIMRGIVESTPGTDPGSGYVAHEINEATVPTQAADSQARNVVTESHSGRSPALSAFRWETTITTEIAGAGYSGGVTEPPISYLLQSAAMKKSDGAVIAIDNVSGTFEIGEVVEKTTGGDDIGKVASASATELILYDVTIGNIPADNDGLTGVTSSATADTNGTPDQALIYRPTSTRSDKKTCTYEIYLDGIKHSSTYTRAGLTLNMGLGPKPSATFNLTGVYNAPSDTSNPSVSYTALTPPDFHGGTLIFGSVTMTDIAWTTLNCDFGNAISLRQNAGSSDGILGVEHTNRNMSISFDPEMSALSDYNPYTLRSNQTANKLQYRWGSAAGNRFIVGWEGAVISDVQPGDRNGIGVFNLTLTPEDVNSVTDSQFFLAVY